MKSAKHKIMASRDSAIPARMGLPDASPRISVGAIRDVLLVLMRKNWESQDTVPSGVDASAKLDKEAKIQELFQKLISHPETVQQDDTQWQQMVAIFKTIVEQNGMSIDPAMEAIIGKSFNGGLDGHPYRHSPSFVKAVAEYVRDLYGAHLMGKRTEVNAAIRLYPIASNGVCLSGEQASVNEAQAQLKAPFLALVKDMLADEVTKFDLQYCPEGSRRHIVVSLEILVGLDPGLITDSFALVAMTYIRERDAIRVVSTFWERVAEQINRAYAELVSILSKGSLSRTAYAALEQNVFHRAIQYYNKSAEGSSETHWWRAEVELDKPLALSKDELHESILEWSADQPTPPTESIETIASTWKSNSKKYQGLAAFVEQRQYTRPNPTALSELTEWVDTHFGRAIPSMSSATKTPQTVQEWYGCKSFKASLTDFEASLSDSASVSSIGCFLDMAVLILNALPEGDPDKRFQLAQFFKKTHCLRIIEDHFLADSFIQTRVKAIRYALARLVNTCFETGLPDPLESATDDFIWRLLVSDPPSEVMEGIKALSATRLSALVARIEFANLFEPGETSPGLSVRLCTWVLSLEVIRAVGSDRIIALLKTRLILAARRGPHVVLRALLNPAVIRELSSEVVLALLQQQGPQGYTLLHVAVLRGHHAIFEALLNLAVIKALGPPSVLVLLQARNTQGFTPLHVAVQNVHQTILRALLNPAVIRELSPELVLTLLQQQGPQGYTLLQLAAQNGHHAIIEALLNLDVIRELSPELVLALLQQQGSQGYTLLHLAAIGGRHAILRALLNPAVIRELSPKLVLTLLQQQGPQGYTLLQLAAQNGHHAIIEALLNPAVIRELSPELVLTLLQQQGPHGYTPLHVAAQNGHHAIIEALLNRAAVGALGPRRVLTLFQVQNIMGTPPLHQAAETGDRAILSVIFNRDVCIALGRDVFLNLLQVEDRQGRTLLQAAVQNSRRDVFQAVLVTDGIDLVDRAAFVRLLTNAMATAYRVGNREDCQFFITQIRDLELAQRISQREMTDILAQLADLPKRR